MTASATATRSAGTAPIRARRTPTATASATARRSRPAATPGIPRAPVPPPARRRRTPPGDGTPPGGGTPPATATPPPADTTAPETTILTGTSGPGSATSAAFTFSADETATFECRIDGGAYSACTSPKSYSGLADGAHTFDVRAKDTAGNVDATPASASWSVDTTPPETTITSGPPAATTDTTAQFTFSADEVSTFQCRLDGGAWAACTSPAALSGLALGAHTYEVRAIDGLGNIDATPAQRTWTIEQAVPDTAVTGGPSGTSFEFSATLTFTSPDPNVTFECRLNGSAWAACSSPTTYLDLLAGDQLFEVRAKSRAASSTPPPPPGPGSSRTRAAGSAERADSTSGATQPATILAASGLGQPVISMPTTVATLGDLGEHPLAGPRR